MKVFIDEMRIKKRISELADEIYTAYEGISLTCVVILKGGFVFASDLIRALNKQDMEVEFVYISSYKGSKSLGKVEILPVNSHKFKDRHILIIEDIIDTGLTMESFMNILNKSNPSSIKICSFLEKREVNNGRINVDFLGFPAPSQFLVGYGLDYDEKYRNLPAVYVLDEEKQSA